MFDSLRSRLIVSLVSLLTILALASGLATLNTMKKDSEQQARQVLRVAANVFLQALENRASQLTNSVSILASDFGFRRAVATVEQETILSVLENHGGRVHADLVLLLSPSGDLLASTSSDLNNHNVKPLFLQSKSNQSGTVNDILVLAGSSYQLVLVPVKAPQTIAWVGMGFSLNKQLAEQIKGITDLDISFTTNSDKGNQTLHSTLDSKTQQSLLPLLPSLVDTRQQPFSSNEDRFLSLALALDQQQLLWAVLHYPSSRWQESYQQIRQQLLVIFGLSLTLALLLAFVIARSITQPLRLLSHFASQIGQGVNTKDLPAAKGEIGLLGNTLQKMQLDIRSREAELLYQAEHDSLTALKNRGAAERKLAELLPSENVGLLLLNIKNFRHINDALGFANGDSLLQQMAQRLHQLQPAPLLAARLGGDEFLLLYTQHFTEEQLEQFIRQLHTGYLLADSPLSLKVSVGAYNIAPGSVHANDAIRRLDIALSHAKQQPGLLAFYQQGQDESHQRELTILRDLPAALQQNQLFVVYQPKVDLAQRSCSSAEALIRWIHPELGFVPPDEFIKLAEHSGNIALVTEWMLNTVVAQLALWYQQGKKITVAVNLSAHDLTNPQLPAYIAALLKVHNLPPAVLALEVTEGAVMQDPKRVIQILSQLRDMGIELAIDDFGTGQSSLAYLKQLPVHEVKIDRAFIKDIEHNQDDALIVSATSQLAHSLGLKVTAEGLENLAGLAKLQQYQCDKIQGYFFSKPLTAEHFSEWLQHFGQHSQQWFEQEVSE
ncbi:EAL domain-containing protein [Rheinheimera mangrovi]|uniref:EAL domain-containing protein n=1 Tax=Rheinheimera mangrovi TaxID=2498451 RepID=UPI000F8E3905|nr:EAL domain-containing protein [Rheinheimera mangrovi]